MGSRRNLQTSIRLLRMIAAISLMALFLLAFFQWWQGRVSHSHTDDAFAEAHIINLAPEMVSGRIVRVFADEGDRVGQGQVVAEIDATSYRDKVNLASSRLDAARRELDRQRADLARLRREVPIQIEIVRRALETAIATRSKAESSVVLTEDDVEKGIDEARAGVKAAKADLLLAVHDRDRFANLHKSGSGKLREQEESTRSHDAAEARLELAQAKLAQAISSRTQVAVAGNSLEPARADVHRSARSVDLSETANDQVRAPISGVVVRRYRNLGDFASVGVAVLSLYDPDLLYVTANLEETRLPGVSPRGTVRLDVDAFSEPF